MLLTACVRVLFQNFVDLIRLLCLAENGLLFLDLQHLRCRFPAINSGILKAVGWEEDDDPIWYDSRKIEDDSAELVE